MYLREPQKVRLAQPLVLARNLTAQHGQVLAVPPNAQTGALLRPAGRIIVPPDVSKRALGPSPASARVSGALSPPWASSPSRMWCCREPAGMTHANAHLAGTRGRRAGDLAAACEDGKTGTSPSAGGCDSTLSMLVGIRPAPSRLPALGYPLRLMQSQLPVPFSRPMMRGRRLGCSAGKLRPANSEFGFILRPPNGYTYPYTSTLRIRRPSPRRSNRTRPPCSPSTMATTRSQTGTAQTRSPA